MKELEDKGVSPEGGGSRGVLGDLFEITGRRPLSGIHVDVIEIEGRQDAGYVKALSTNC